MGTALSASRCRYHPERDGVGVCMRCRTVICPECTTRFDGINHCAVCVAELTRGVESQRGEVGMGWRLAGALLLYGVLALGLWGVLHMMFFW